MTLFNRAEFNVEPILEPPARNPPRNSCCRVGRNHWHDSTEHRSDSEFSDVTLNSMDARCNCRVAFIFLVVRERTRVATERRHGWTIAILISGIMFFLDHHLSHAYATFVFLPFFLAISVVHGLLVKYSGSIGRLCCCMR